RLPGLQRRLGIPPRVVGAAEAELEDLADIASEPALVDKLYPVVLNGAVVDSDRLAGRDGGAEGLGDLQEAIALVAGWRIDDRLGDDLQLDERCRQDRGLSCP